MTIDAEKPIPKRVLLLGATLDTQNMGVGALAAGAVRCVLTQYPHAEVFLLDYAVEPAIQRVRWEGAEIPVPLINLRFSKKFYLPNNIALLLAIAAFLKLVPSAKLRARLARKNHWLAEIYSADLVTAISGGDSFSDIYGIGRLLYCALPQMLCILLGRRLVLLPQTFGPFRSPISRIIAKYILRKSERVYSRDYRSLALLKSLLGPEFTPEKCGFSFDLGFALDPIRPRSLDIEGISLEATRDNIIGLNVSGLLLMGGYTQNNMFGLLADYRLLIPRLVDFFITTQGAKVLLIPHVFGSDPESDVSACENVYNNLKQLYGSQLGVVRGSLDQNAVKYIVGRCGFFVGSRMHACIAAISQCVPSVAIAYSDKFIGVIDTIATGGHDSLSSLVADARKLQNNEILEVVAGCYQKRAAIRDSLACNMPRVRSAALRLFSENSPTPQQSSMSFAGKQTVFRGDGRGDYGK